MTIFRKDWSAVDRVIQACHYGRFSQQKNASTPFGSAQKGFFAKMENGDFECFLRACHSGHFLFLFLQRKYREDCWTSELRFNETSRSISFIFNYEKQY